MNRLAYLGLSAALGGLAALLAPGAVAQVSQDSDVIVGRGDTEPPPPVDDIDRVAPQRDALGRPFAGRRSDQVKTVRPGALLIASFDANHDGRITRTEFDAGARSSFRAADANGDGVIAGFEQNDWARAVGTSDDILSNPMTFDADIDRNVTEAEFVGGLRRIAEAVAESGSGDILFESLIQPLRPSESAQGRGGSFDPSRATGPLVSR